MGDINGVYPTDPNFNERVAAGLTIVFPEIRDPESKVAALPEKVRRLIADAVEDIPHNYWVTREWQERIHRTYTEYLHSVQA